MSKNNSQKFIVQVAPVIPLPAARTQVFSYWHDEDLPVGAFVGAPFYLREIEGVVVNSRRSALPKNSLKLKNISSVKEKDLLSKNQITLAKKIADYYFAPLGSVLKLMVPKMVKMRESGKEPSKKPKKGEKVDPLALAIWRSAKKKFLLFGSGQKREKASFGLIRQCLKRNKQCLLLVPEIFFSESVFERVQSEFSEEIVLIHSRITKGRYYHSWKKIRSGEAKIVIALSQGIFLPFCDLGLVIVEEEQDASFKRWESMPRYNAARGAEFLADLFGAKLVLGSSTPSSESWYRAKQGDLELMSLDDNLPKIEIAFPDKVASSATRRGGGNADFPISQKLYSHLAATLKNKKQAALFVNRRGFSTRTMCENCKRVLKCPKCDRALVYSEDGGQYRCLHCAFKMDILSACPSCGGFQFSHRGIGTQTVEKKVQKLFPSARVVRLDADQLRRSADHHEILQKFARGEVDILVGTQSVIKGIYSDKIELAASISGRDFSDGIEFNSRALSFSRIFHMANLLGGRNGTLLVQTFFGGNPLFDYFEKNELKKYFAREIAMRKKFGYPPFFRFVKLVFRDKSQKNAIGETKKTFDLLRRAGNNMVEIIGPYEPGFSAKKGLYQRNILVKFDPKKDVRDLPVRSVFGGLRKGWVIDVDPVSLF